MNKNLVKTMKSVSTGLVFVAILFAFLISGIRILGFEVYGVLTGSMEPTYPTGSLIYVKDVDASDLRVNDVITFSLSPNVIATHRIVELVPDENNPSIVRFRTKGDANDVVDASLVSANNIIGKVSFCVPQLGYLASYIQEPPGIYVAILVCLLMIGFVFFADSLDPDKKKQQTVNDKQEPAVGLTEMINKLAVKVLGKPLLKTAEKEQPAAFQQSQQPVQQPYQQQPSYQPVQQPHYGMQQPYQQGFPQQNYQQFPQQGYQPQQNFPQQSYQQSVYQQPQFQQQFPAQQPYQQPVQQPQFQPYQQPQMQQQWAPPANQWQPDAQPQAPQSAPAPKAYPTMFNQQQANAPRRRSQRVNQ